jgi:glycosyltransferase involved in cell wall biosynthesis
MGIPACRVWLINHYASPPDRSAGTRHYSIARELVGRGMDVTIFAAGFDHATSREERVHGRRLTRIQWFSGVRFEWLRTFPYRGNNWRRMANMASFALLVCLVQLRRPAPDVVVGSTVHPFAALAGWVIAKLRGARYVYEVRDLWPQTLIDLGALDPNAVSARLLSAIEAFLVRRAETVVTVLPGMSTYLDDRGLPSAHVRYLPNGVDLAAADLAMGMTDRAGRTDSMSRLLVDVGRRRESGEVVFAYTGAHGRVNRLEIVLAAFDLANRREGTPIHLLLVGDGPEKTHLRQRANELGLTNVTFADPVPKDQLPALLNIIDVGVVHATATPIYRFGVSFNKVFDYMAARKPIVFACTTFNDPIAASGAGRTVVPDDPRKLADAVISLAASGPEERRRMGEAGRIYAERHHDLARIGAEFAEIVSCSDEPQQPSEARPIVRQPDAR